MGKRCVLYVGFQDGDGLQDVTVRQNDFAFTFDFTRINQGVFEISNFNPLKHRIIGTPYQQNFRATWDSDGSGQFYTYNNSGNRDDAFVHGGYIEIEEFKTIIL